MNELTEIIKLLNPRKELQSSDKTLISKYISNQDKRIKQLENELEQSENERIEYLKEPGEFQRGEK